MQIILVVLNADIMRISIAHETDIIFIAGAHCTSWRDKNAHSGIPGSKIFEILQNVAICEY